MSKHLLYCKDLLNRTLTRSLLFVLAQLIACLIVLTQVLSPAEAAGPLSVKPTNPHYFFDPKGKSVYLTGSYLNEYNTLSGSLDFASYLDFLQQQKQNFTRVWGWEQSPWIYDNTGEISFSSQPYERTGPGLALDGGLKFDLTRFNQAYFDQLRSRVVEAAQRGIYVSVMLFEGFSTQKKMGRVNPWLGDPFQQVNNINGVNGDPNRNGGNEEFFSLAFPSLVSLQEAFARKVVDTLNDLDNVLYEVNGNGLAGSLSWQYHMIDYIKHYQKKPANQHPVGISDFYAGATADVFNSSAEWIVIPETNLNPPAGNTKKVLIMEGTPPVSGGQAISTSPISLVQLLPDNVVSTQSSGTWNDSPSSNGVTLLSSSATSSALNTTKSSSKNQQSQVATPTITPNGGVYSGTVPVTLQTATPGASIYYTTDGQSPTQSSRLYTGKFTLSDSTLVKAKAFKSNLQPSSEASAWFANAASTAVGPSGLVAYWKFDEGSGTTAADASGNGNTGTLVNGPLWTAGKVGNALYFDGNNDNVTVPDSASLHLSNAFTLSAWVNPTVAPSNFTAAIAKNTASDHVYFLYATSGDGYCSATGFPLAGANITGVQRVICNSSGLPLNTWSHLTSTYDGSSFKFYVNGSLGQTVPFTGTIDPSTGTLQIGASLYGEYFKGFIDEVRIYNRALSATEIQAIYQQDSAATSQTVATPVISPNSGNYIGSVSVTMQTATSGASIYYTTDGSTPTQASTLYTGTMNLTSSATVKAKTFKNGSNASAEASASFTVTQPFSFSLSNSGDKSVLAGSSVTNSISTTLISGSAQAVTLSASGLPTGATASFSSTSCSPTCSSTLSINTTNSTATGSSNVTVTASGGGVTKTTTFSLTVSLPPMTTVATPTITPNGGSFTSSVSVTMQTATSGASIYYTTNGSSPTQSSTLYTGAITLTSSATVRAKAFKNGYQASAEASASFTVIAAWTFCALENSPCNFSGTKEVRYGTNGMYVSQIFTNGVSCDNNVFGDPADGYGKECDYRDASSPPATSTVIQPFSFSLSNSGDKSVVAGSSVTNSISAVLTSGSAQAVSLSASGLPTGATASFSSVSCSPTCSSTLTINTNASTPAGSSTITVTATGGGVTKTTTLGLNVSLPTLAAPTISPNGGSYTGSVSVTMQTATSGASIYYTTNGSSPSQSSTLYTGALTLTSNAIVKAKAFKSGYNASAESSASFTVAAPLTTAWTFCALENSPCSFSGTKEVRYGSNGVYVSQIFTNGVSCDNNVFGDPAVGYGKACDYRDVSSSPFSFSLSNSGDQSVVAGSSVTNSISTTLTSGSSQAVSFAVTGIPAGATGSFSSTACNPSCSTVLNIVTTGSTPAGNFPITVTSIGGSVTKTTAFTLSVTLALTSSSVLPSTGTGNTYYVAKTGSDSNSCATAAAAAKDSTKAMLTIKNGISCLASGDTLMIKAGTYDERLTNNSLINQGLDGTGIPSGTSETNRTTLLAADGPGTVIILPSARNGNSLLAWPNTGGPFQYMTFDGLVFDGFNIDCGLSGPGNISACEIIYLGPTVGNMTFNHVTIRNGGMVTGFASNHNGVVGVLGGGYSHVKFLNSTFSDNGQQLGDPATNQGNTAAAYHVYITGVGGTDLLFDNDDFIRSGGYSIHMCCQGTGSMSNIEVRNSRFSECGIVSRDLQSTSCILLGPTLGNSVHHNVIYNSYSDGMGIYTGAVYNNTIYGNRRRGLSLGFNSVYRNNLVFGNNTGNGGFTDIGFDGSTTGSVLDHNLCGTTDFAGACSVTTNPTLTFVDVVASDLLNHHDFHLTSGSPARGQGVLQICASCGPGGTPINTTSTDLGALPFSGAVIMGP